jgi:HEPN domain-containing protein
VNALDETAYRLALAEGFLGEAEQDFSLERWRSCGDNSQVAVENSGKSVLVLFGVAGKTHEPARELAAVLRNSEIPLNIRSLIERLLPELLALGAAEHFLTDYGDEAARILPWALFTRESAHDALNAARRSLEIARSIIRTWESRD